MAARRQKKKEPERKLRILSLVHPDLVPPDEVEDASTVPAAPWKTEYDVIHALRELGHEVHIQTVGGELGGIRNAMFEFKPHLAFNMLEGFDDVVTFEANVVAYLELLKLPYSGCNSRGLLLARDKALAKKILSYHRIPAPDFAIVPKGRRFRRPRRLEFPLFVKSLTLDASIGISQASVVEDEPKLQERVRFVHESLGTDALVERFIDGRELYVGVMGNHQLRALPIWELLFTKMPEEVRRIATERLKWSLTYQKKHGIVSEEAKDLTPAQVAKIQELCKKVYRVLNLSGYARIDLRLAADGKVYVLEANPNPQLSRDEDFACAAKQAGIAYPDLVQKIVELGLRWEPTRWG
ncbi:MAG TPA: ATP-grasp domain-containing protein [Vicinamibacteria bacterium]|nr:ATP-grasp domain-containing protein [Vicinamibacteria bacterium]